MIHPLVDSGSQGLLGGVESPFDVLGGLVLSKKLNKKLDVGHPVVVDLTDLIRKSIRFLLVECSHALRFDSLNLGVPNVLFVHGSKVDHLLVNTSSVERCVRRHDFSFVAII